MKRISGIFAAVTACIITAAMSLTVSAADVSIDVSGAVTTEGNWDQAFSYTTPVITEKDGFDPRWMTPGSVVIVEHTYEGRPVPGYPAELVWQTWKGGPVDPDPDVKKMWNRVAPFEYDEHSSKYSYADIVAAYGTDNFSTVYAICVCDTDVKLSVTGMTVTNCKVPGEEEPETLPEEPEEEYTEIPPQQEITVSEEVTSPETAPALTESVTVTEAVTEAAPEPVPEKKGSGGIIIAVIAAIAVISGGAAAAVKTAKKNKTRLY